MSDYYWEYQVEHSSWTLQTKNFYFVIRRPHSEPPTFRAQIIEHGDKIGGKVCGTLEQAKAWCQEFFQWRILESIKTLDELKQADKNPILVEPNFDN